MKVYDRYHNPVGILDETAGEISVLSGVMPSDVKKKQETRRQKNGEYFWAKELADWFFASGVIAVLGSIVYLFSAARFGYEFPLSGASLILPTRFLLMAPLSFVIRFLSVLFLFSLHYHLGPLIVLYMLQVINAFLMSFTNQFDFFSVSGFINLVIEIIILILLRRMLKAYLKEAGVKQKKPFFKEQWEAMSGEQRAQFKKYMGIFLYCFLVFGPILLTAIVSQVMSFDYFLESESIVFMLLLFRIAETVQYFLTARRIREAF